MSKFNFKNKNIISINNLKREEILYILKKAKEFKNNPKSNLLNDKIIGSLFFEPSTRTRLSFEAAVNRLGGRVIGFADSNVTSTKKGESLHDTIKIIGQYCDLIVMRHPRKGSVIEAGQSTDKPIINAGDGTNQHPTQTLLDLFTIQETQGKIKNLSIAFVGDLKYGRTANCLALALQHFNSKMYFIAPKELQMQSRVLDKLDKNKIEYSLHERMGEVINEADILYMTRIQQERFANVDDYKKLKGTFVLKKEMLEDVKNNFKIMHPLPRVDEINKEVDTTPFACYFQQAQNGLYLREALLSLILGVIK